jgi:hypothetical protein
VFYDVAGNGNGYAVEVGGASARRIFAYMAEA